ncbi:MAG TPA: hypothetical protein VNG33_04395 [Polyangiaceae bacterium]|nr:hypothetical protein [Polyangiaceae bacterium]
MRFRVLFAFGPALFSSFLAASARAEEPLPPATTAAAPAMADLPPPSARVNLIITGATTTLVSYGLALGASYLWTADDLNGSKDLRIPVAGPWLALGKTGCSNNDPGCSKPLLVIGALLQVLDGVVQAGGLGIVGEGLFLNTSSSRSAPRKAEGPRVQALPLNFEKGGVGLGVVGTF